jgi:hypothetical protein
MSGFSNAAGTAIARCSVKKSANHTAADYSTATAVTWDTNVVDTSSGAIHSTSSNTDQFVTPAGVTRANIGFRFVATSVAAAAWAKATVTKNGTDIAWASDGGAAAGTIGAMVQGQTGPVVAAPGDIFRVTLQCSDNSIDISAALSGAWAEFY